MAIARIVAVAAAAAALLAEAVQVTPTQQVITMLTELKAKGEKMLETEQKTYAAYAEWVDDESKRLGFEIQDGEKKIEELTAFASKADSDAAELGREVEALDAEIAKLEGEKKAATDMRATEHDEYLKVSQDYGESVDALQRAIQVVKSQNYDRAQAESLLQRMSSTVPGMSRVLAALLQEKSRSLRGRMRSVDEEPGAPEVAAYEFQSGGIQMVLEGLLKKFKQELADVEEDEANRAHEFDLVELHLSDTIAKDTSDRDEKAALRGKRMAESAKAKGELAEANKEKAADEKLKAEIQATFAAKTATYEENQEVRKQEIQAITKAIEIISSPAVAASYSKHINLAQVASRAGVSFLQTTQEGTKNEALGLLRRRARELKSGMLAEAAASLAANPSFAKVIDMIEDLLEKLKAEAAAEADHHAWCNEQLKANKLKRNKKTAKANTLSAEIDGHSADIADMAKTIARLAEEQRQLTEAMAEATKLRDAEHAENTATIADAAAGSEAVKQALVILKEFYSSQEGEASLLQEERQVPEMAEYKGMQDAKGGVIGMLEVIEADFARLRAETESSEATAASQYKTFMEESTAAKKAKHEEEFKLSLDKDQSEFEREQTQKELRSTEAELAQANKYFEYLKPACLQVHVNWEEREAKRKEEIQALKEAWEILDRKGKE